MAVASLILGIFGMIFGVFCSAIPVINWIGVIMAIAGVVLGAIGKKNPEKAGLATAGMIISIIALALGLMFTLICGSVACLACVESL